MNKRILIAILILALVVTTIPVFLAARPEKPLFTFAHIPDLHTGGESNKLPEAPITQLIVQDLIDEKNHPLPDFVILNGDLVDYDLDVNCNFQRENVEAEFRKVKEIFNQLPIPWYPVMGNHDNWEGDYAFWDKHFPGKRRYYFAYGDYLFIALDDFRRDDNSPEAKERRQWLRGLLDAHPKKLIILIAHTPLIEMKPRLKNKHWYYVVSTVNPSVKDIIEGHHNVIAVLSGHLHFNEVIVENGIYYIVTASVATHPPMYHSFEVYPDRIEVRSHWIGDPAFQGKKCWWDDGYTKDEDYTRPEVENFTIPIH